ncbi:hypothetical protein BWD42_04050 [Sphingobacterium sp. CZ-UAM]|uniref:hypothetical protein n=1 Tax=Sphingobacterium sp. CZ-UAM TaxID=1933868 RepID=UPI0009874985|nr:hypothetical protein [Sphingobacterium sp. CZ-UAM]OOG19130.1 hypothetical protein BWD42_04050 [Sphingobacterium sp. CZ-UAM]
MTVVELNSGTKVKMYSSIKEMPVKVFNIFQGYMIQESGIGSTMESVNDHFEKLDTFLSVGKIEDAIVERENLHYNIYSALEGISYKSLAFGCFIHAIDGGHVSDYSTENLQEILGKLSDQGLTIGMVEEQLDQIKKKLISN